MKLHTKLSVDEVVGACGIPFEEWAFQCHGISHAIVKAGLVKGRVARGWCRGVMGQHSWVVEGSDCYDKKARVIDPTLWSYREDVEGIWYGTYKDGFHEPHGGFGSIWGWGRPGDPVGPVVELTPTFELSESAVMFLDMLGPLDKEGWMVLTNAPPGGWPAGEIYAAMDDTPGLGVLIPIDKLGMLTDRNPKGLYF